MLKSITFPTGATREFVYEANQYKKGDKLTNGSGLRIKTITDYLADGISEEMNYLYEDPDFPDYLLPRQEYYVTERWVKEYHTLYHEVAGGVRPGGGL